MFKQLEELLAKASISMTISAKGNSISVTVIPKGKNGVPISNTPLAISGTAEELDEKLVPEIVKVLNESLGFLTSAESFKEAAKKEEADAKKEKVKDTPKTEAATAKAKDAKAEVFKPNKEQTSAIAKAKKSLEDAKKAVDPDMVNFFKKQTITLYQNAKMPEDKIKALEHVFNEIPLLKSKAKVEPDLFDKQEVEEKTEPVTEDVSEQEEIVEPEDETDQPEDVVEASNNEESVTSNEEVNEEVDEDDIF